MEWQTETYIHLTDRLLKNTFKKYKRTRAVWCNYMKIRNTLFTIGFLWISQLCFGQIHKESGILILSTRRDHTSFDLFVPGKIDKAKTLKENLTLLRDTAIRFGVYENELLSASMLKSAFKFVNESEINGTDRDLLVLVVEAKYEDEDYNRLLPNEFYDYEIILYSQKVVEVYDNKKPFFKKLKVINLPK